MYRCLSTRPTDAVATGKGLPVEQSTMADITILELNLEGSSLNLPFSNSGNGDDSHSNGDTQIGIADSESDVSESGGNNKVRAIVAVFAFFVVAAALVKYFTGDEEEEVEIETADEPIGVTLDDDER